MKDVFAQPLADLVVEAWSMRDQFDLGGVGYGRIHWGNRTDVMSSPFPYYFFLAGITRVTQAQKIVEVGTHHGGSTKALKAGLVQPDQSCIVTFDPSGEAVPTFATDKVVRAFALDANTEEAIACAVREFGGMSCDIAYVDSTHSFGPTLHSWLLYGRLFSPSLVILDDITLNDSMQSLWQMLVARFGKENAVDASEIVPEIRATSDGTRPGFGVLRVR